MHSENLVASLIGLLGLIKEQHFIQVAGHKLRRLHEIDSAGFAGCVEQLMRCAFSLRQSYPNQRFIICLFGLLSYLYCSTNAAFFCCVAYVWKYKDVAQQKIMIDDDRTDHRTLSDKIG
jgi:hypothetical protein